MANRFKLPPCGVNPLTEKPYARHKWEIVQGILKTDPKTGATLYHVRCARETCRLNLPDKVLH